MKFRIVHMVENDYYVIERKDGLLSTWTWTGTIHTNQRDAKEALAAEVLRVNRPKIIDKIVLEIDSNDYDIIKQEVSDEKK